MRTRENRSGEQKQRRAGRLAKVAASAATLVLLAATGATAAPHTIFPTQPITQVSQDAQINNSVASKIAKSAKLDSKGNNAILNMFQWTWKSVAAECASNIGPAGFAYVQVSPPQEHILGEQWWTSYQPVSYKVESKLGTRAEFKNMIDTCKDAGVGIIADAVINHMTGQDSAGTGFAGTQYSEESYPGPDGTYDSSNFHSCKTDIQNYNDRSDVQNCRLVKLQDLDTSQAYVQEEIAAYLDDLADLGVAGYRIDAAKHMAADDIAGIKAKTTKAKDLYWIFEVIGSGSEPVQPTEYISMGDSHEFNYARILQSAFDGRISQLQKLAANQDLLNGYNAGVFVDNHDTERNGETLNYKDASKYLLANVFLFSYPYGSPSAYTGYTFTDRDAGAPQDTNGNIEDVDCSDNQYTCIHRQPEIANMVGFYNDARSTELNNWQNAQNGSVVGYGRGDKGFVVLNNSDASVTQTFSTRLPQGTYCNSLASTTLSGCAEEFTVAADGTVEITVEAGRAALLWTKYATTQGASTPAYSGTTTVYFHKYDSWAGVNVHHALGNGSWTAAPGDVMTEVCDGWYAADISASTPVEGVFNDGTSWNNALYGGNYTLGGENVTVSHGVAIDYNPCDEGAYKNTVIYYKVNPDWEEHNIHYQVGIKGWTQVPGKQLSPACEGWVRRTIETRGDELTFVFNSGKDVWDNADNATGNYVVAAPLAAVNDKVITYENPCAGQEELPELPEPEEPGETTDPLAFDEIKVFYARNASWETHNIHYGIGANWTSVPGVAMTETCDGWLSYTITGTKGAEHVESVFNNGDSDWDNNGGVNYKLTTPVVSISAGVVTTDDPCATETEPTEEPTEEPTQEPTEEPSQEPTSGPTQGGGTDDESSPSEPAEPTESPEPSENPASGSHNQQDENATASGQDDSLAETGTRIMSGVLYLSVLLLLAGTATVIGTYSRKHNTQ